MAGSTGRKHRSLGDIRPNDRTHQTNPACRLPRDPELARVAKPCHRYRVQQTGLLHLCEKTLPILSEVCLPYLTVDHVIEKRRSPTGGPHWRSVPSPSCAWLP